MPKFILAADKLGPGGPIHTQTLVASPGVGEDFRLRRHLNKSQENMAEVFGRN
jgi:hypothetical protein